MIRGRYVFAAIGFCLLSACQTVSGGVIPCRPEDWTQNWARVSDMDRSLGLFTNLLGFRLESEGTRVLEVELSDDNMPRRMANLCHGLGPIGGLRLIEVAPDELTIPIDDQGLIIELIHADPTGLMGDLPTELGEGAQVIFLGKAPSISFVDWDGNQINVIPARGEDK